MTINFQENEPLDVVIVVRGTNERGDILSVTMLDAADLRNGKAQNGVSESG